MVDVKVPTPVAVKFTSKLSLEVRLDFGDILVFGSEALIQKSKENGDNIHLNVI